jgi:pimeloyl-ACP methyl ester carboxylesterase
VGDDSGESLTNPPLILLHGGPGFSETRLFRHFNAPLEKSFTVVYWDQRGTGKSFDTKIPRCSMTVERFIADLDELVDAVCNRVGKKKVAIFGHSWGSALGVLYAARFPEKVAAYVGSGQIGDWPAGESSSYAFVLAEAQRLNNRKALKTLRHRPATSQREELVDAAHVAESRRGPPTRKLPVGPGTNLLWRAGIIDLRSAQYAACLSVFSRRYVGRSFEAESRETRARVADARVLLSRAPRTLGRP